MRHLVADRFLLRCDHQDEKDPVQERHGQQTHPAEMLETVIVGPHTALQGKADAGANALNSLNSGVRVLPNL